MRKFLFALAMLIGAFALTAGTPAQAMTAGAVTGMSDIVKADATAEKVYHRRGRFCRWHPYNWRCRHRRHHRRYHRGPWWW